MVFQVAEPTLSPEVANLLEGFLGCKIAREGILPDRSQFDFFLFLDSSKVVVELKIGGFQKLPIAIAQAEDYKEKIGADGIIAVVYPDEARKEVTKPEDVRDIALGLRPTVMVLCPFLKEYYPQTSLAELAKNLKDSLAKPTLAPSVDLVVEALRQSVQGIALEIKRSAGIDSPIIKETVGSLVLFEILSEESQDSGEQAQDEAVKGVVADLAAYILVNQLLLHHILSKNLSLPKSLAPISAPVELNAYFKEIQDIDYKAVYCIDVASNIPPAATTEINTAIIAIRAIQPENLKHDLLGRIFHEFLPQETRKRLGTFYTRPQAAEILAGLSIDRADEKVLDPACGSGTLLVSAYRKKTNMGKKVRSHKKLVEEELTGVDIMPFSAHLAALNLTMQSPKEPTNRTRIGIGNSLHLVRGSEIGDVARWMKTFGGEVTGADTEQPLTKGEVFNLEPVNLVIMNPPFTRKERLTPGMKGIGLDIFGEQNYWAYFIALADSLLRKNGKIAAVLPRDFFRGEYSRTVREYLFKTGAYSLRYVVKTTRDTAFSESARFRDFLIVLQKGGSPSQSAFVYLKKRLSEISMREAMGIPITVRQAEESKEFDNGVLSIVWRKQEEIWTNWQDLGHLVVFNTRSGEKLTKFYQNALSKAGKKMTRLGSSSQPIQILRGLEPSVENLLDLIFIVRPIDKGRLGHSKVILNSEETDKVTAVMKGFGTSFEIPKQAIRMGLKTAAYVPRLDVGGVSDLAITKSFDGMQEIQRRLNVREVDFKNIRRQANDRLSHLLVSRRFNFAAPGTKAVSFFSSEKALAGKAFWTLSTDVPASKVLCLWLNSTLAFIESLLLQTETEGSFVEITKEKLLEFHIPNLASCDTSGLLAAFDKVRYVEFPPLVQQFENPPEARQIIDRAVLKTIGYDDKEIDELLPDIYQAMATEMQSWQELMRKPSAEEKEPSLQLHLLPTE